MADTDVTIGQDASETAVDISALGAPAPAGRSGAGAMCPPRQLAAEHQRMAEFRQSYEAHLANLEQVLAERLVELEERTRRGAEADCALAAEEIARQRKRLKKREARLEAELDRVELRRARMRVQRRRLALLFRMKRRQLRKLNEAAASPEQIRKLMAERDALAERLTAAVQQLELVAADPEAGEAEQLKERLQRALGDVHDLKRRNAELEQQAAGHAKGGNSEAGDWESQKRRMLAALEADEAANPDDQDRMQDRLTIDGTIRITDEVVQQKDREIRELKEQLEGQVVAPMLLPDVAAMAEIVDGDEVIRQERERLKQLEADWQERLRQAEIDLSMERAKQARQQAELEELRRLQQAAAETEDGEDAKASPRGRWLARLGLKEGE